MGRRRAKPKLDQDNLHSQTAKVKVVKTLVNQQVRSSLHSRARDSETESWKSEGDAEISDDSEISDTSFEEAFLRSQQRPSIKNLAAESRISPSKPFKIETSDILTPERSINPLAKLQTLSSSKEEPSNIEEIIRKEISNLTNDIKTEKKTINYYKKLSSIYKKSAEDQSEHLSNIKSHKRQVKDLEEENQRIKLQISKLEDSIATIPDLQGFQSRIQEQLKSRDAEIDRLLGNNLESLELSESFQLYNLMNEVVKKVQNEVIQKSDRFQSLAKCVICMEKGRCIILQPCGHFCMCEICGNTVCVCPVCRGSIQERIRALV